MAPSWYFPTIDVFLTIAPKNGSTTSKSYLLALELASQPNANSSEFSRPNPKVHGSTEINEFSVELNAFTPPDSSMNLLVVRNPYERTRSTWLNKFVFAQYHYHPFGKYRGQSFVPETIESLEQLNSAFVAYTERLASDKKFLLSDLHWSPQVQNFREASHYDLIIETKDLPNLKVKLAGHVSKEVLSAIGDIPKFNETQSPIAELVGSEQAWLDVEKAYFEDFDFFKSAGVEVLRPKVSNLEGFSSLAQLLADVNKEIVSSRAHSEPAFLRDQISKLQSDLDALKQSKSWRYTAWLRKIDDLINRR